VCSAIPGWTCDPQYYDTGLADDCDCGCGIIDPDCPNSQAASCDYCDAGSCANDGTTFGCDIPLLVPNDNAVCI
jgi:hypothetical protein